MSKKTENILAFMNVLAWIAFIGLLVKAGALLVSFGVSVVKPEAAKNLYEGLDMSAIRDYSLWHYVGRVSMLVLSVGMQAQIAYMLTQVLSKIKLVNPFTMEVAQMLEKMSYVILGAWAVTTMANAHAQWLYKRLELPREDLMSTEFIFLAGIVFVIAQIFKKGVELQSENELTV
jgi:hypothetical protein